MAEFGRMTRAVMSGKRLEVVESHLELKRQPRRSLVQEGTPKHRAVALPRAVARVRPRLPSDAIFSAAWPCPDDHAVLCLRQTLVRVRPAGLPRCPIPPAAERHEGRRTWSSWQPASTPLLQVLHILGVLSVCMEP